MKKYQKFDDEGDDQEFYQKDKKKDKPRKKSDKYQYEEFEYNDVKYRKHS